MKNIELNIGGLIGALVCCGAALAFQYSTGSLSQQEGRPVKLLVSAMVGGAVAGNFLWGKLIKQS